MALSNLILSDLERSKARSLRFSVIGDLDGIHTFASSSITTLIWMSQKAVCWQAGFPLSQRSFLLLLDFLHKHIVHTHSYCKAAVSLYTGRGYHYLSNKTKHHVSALRICCYHFVGA